MKKSAFILVITLMLLACGGKESTETLTKEQEDQVVEETSQELNQRINDISTQVDSLTKAADSLLNSIEN
jgi:uncharacterized protein YcfL